MADTDQFSVTIESLFRTKLREAGFADAQHEVIVRAWQEARDLAADIYILGRKDVAL